MYGALFAPAPFEDVVVAAAPEAEPVEEPLLVVVAPVSKSIHQLPLPVSRTT